MRSESDATLSAASVACHTRKPPSAELELKSAESGLFSDEFGLFCAEYGRFCDAYRDRQPQNSVFRAIMRASMVAAAAMQPSTRRSYVKVADSTKYASRSTLQV